MKQQALNPYLPLWEYVPDGEPHVFGDRVYIYGSHDAAGASVYCAEHYTVWSAPVTDLSDWRCEGVSYRREQDPSNPEGKMQLWAPDVTIGPDGRYYMYYCFPFYPEIGIAVSDSPAGPFQFYGHVQHPDGRVLSEYLVFDPGLLRDDDGTVHLYYGFAPEHSNPNYPIVPSPGCMTVELEPDMKTIRTQPVLCVPGAAHAKGTSFEGHAFYEASSMRKINGKYYLIYSSQLSHELCYATSQYPDRDFTYGGTIVSNGDIGYHGRTVPVNMTGNNHGSLECIQGQWYIFYHRQTHATEASRQGCAEPVEILPDGRIPQVEITSCGLNGGPLVGRGSYSAGIACHLTGAADSSIIVLGQDRKATQPYQYQDPADRNLHYIANIQNETVFGFKYFALENQPAVSVTVRGKAQGRLELYTQEPDGAAVPAGTAAIHLTDSRWTQCTISLAQPLTGVFPLYFRFAGEGALDAKDIAFPEHS